MMEMVMRMMDVVDYIESVEPALSGMVPGLGC